MTGARALTAVLVGPAMPPTGTGYAGAVWIGTVQDTDLLAGRVQLDGLDGYGAARLLVRAGRVPRGFVQVPVRHGGIDLAQACAAVHALPPAQQRASGATPPITVVLCTYDRPQSLAQALASLLNQDYPAFEIVVVDNHPASGRTAPVVQAVPDPRVRLVGEPRRGLARARNTGVLAAGHELVAFTDDDVCIDRHWLRGIADGFAAGAAISCVSGIVATGEIASSAQAYFDRRVSWARSCRAEVFSLARPPAGEPLFPFEVSRFGTGANFAVRRSALVDLGGFDEGLGVGSVCGGGEDIDLFVRVLLAGHELAYEPSALVWHRHRADVDGLTAQITDYGTGLGAWLTKLALQPRTLAMMIRRLGPGTRHLRGVTQVTPAPSEPLPEHYALWRVERRGVLRGPLALAAARLTGARARPLARPRRTELTTTTAHATTAEQR